jgi:hypothetical protein
MTPLRLPSVLTVAIAVSLALAFPETCSGGLFGDDELLVETTAAEIVLSYRKDKAEADRRFGAQDTVFLIKKVKAGRVVRDDKTGMTRVFFTSPELHVGYSKEDRTFCCDMTETGIDLTAALVDREPPPGWREFWFYDRFHSSDDEIVVFDCSEKR